MGPSWPRLGPMLALCVGLCWPILGPMSGPCWRYPRPSTLKDLQDANFSVPDPSVEAKTTQKKKHGFLLSPRKKWDRPRPRNTVNSGVFVTSHARSTVNYSGVGRSVVGPGWVGGRGGQRISAGPVDGQSPRPKAASFSYSPYRRPMLRHRKTS